jgi:hypothetical protein
MCKGRGFVYLSYFTVLVLALVLVLAIPQSTVLAKEPFTFPTSDNVTTLPGLACLGGIGINNSTINIDYFGELGSGVGVWQYPSGYRNVYQETPYMSFDAKLPQPLSAGTVTQCYPLTGTTNNWYEAIVLLDLDGGAPDVEVHREIMVPSNQSYFTARYTIKNIKGSSMSNFRFFQGVDYDMGVSFSDDEGGYNGNDFVWEHDLGGLDTYVGFKGDTASVHHDVNTFPNMWNDVAAGTLNDATHTTGDVSVAMEWDYADLPAGGSKTITVTFAFARAFNDLSSALLGLPSTEAPQPKSSPPSATPQKFMPAVFSTNYARVSPQQTYADQPVTISANVVNSGGETGNYQVVLKINGQTEQTKMVSVGPGGTYPVKFTVTKDQPGQYVATIDGHQADFVVLGDKTSKSSSSTAPIIFVLAGIMVLVVVAVTIFSFRRSA